MVRVGPGGPSVLPARQLSGRRLQWVSATKFAEVERRKRGLPRENWYVIKSQRGISSSNEFPDSYLSILNSTTYKTRVVDLENRRVAHGSRREWEHRFDGVLAVLTSPGFCTLVVPLRLG